MNSRILLVMTGTAGIIQSIWHYTQLPERVASHFGPSGIADGWMSSLANLCVSAALFILMTLIMFFVPKLVSVVPVRFVNLPNRDYWLADERKKQTLDDIAERMATFGIAINLCFIFIMHMVYKANMSGTQILDENTFLMVSGIFMLFMAGWLFSFFRRFRKQA